MSSIDAAALAPVHRRVWQNNRPRRPPPMTSSTGNRSDGHGLCHGLDSAPAPRMSARHKVMLQLAHELPVAELVEQSSSSARTETPVAVFSSLILATSPHSSPHTRGNAGCSQLCVRSTELELRRSHPVQKVQHAFLHRSVQIRHIVCLSVKCSRIPIRDRSSARRVSLSLAVTIVCMSLSQRARSAPV